MSFESVAKKIAKKQGVSKERASAILAAGTRRAMKAHGISSAHGIPSHVWSKRPQPQAKCEMAARPMEKRGEPCSGRFCR